MANVLQFLPLFFVMAVVLTVLFSELVKRLDKKDRLKGYRVWIPFVLSAGFAFLLWKGAFFAPSEVWFWWAAIFGCSVFFYEAILKHIKKFAIDGKDRNS